MFDSMKPPEVWASRQGHDQPTNRLAVDGNVALNFWGVWTEGTWPAGGNCVDDEDKVEFDIVAEGASCSISV